MFVMYFLYIGRLFFFAFYRGHLKCKNGRDFYLCNSHATPSLIKTLLDGHIVITTELI